MTWRTLCSNIKQALFHPLETSICLLLLGILTASFLQVVFRYFFEAPLSWSEELSRFLLMWLTMLSAAYGFKVKAHFSLRFIVDRVNPDLRHQAGLFSLVITILFLLIFSYFSFEYAWSAWAHTSPAMGIPMAIPYLSAFVGSVMMLYYVSLEALQFFSQKAEEE